MLSFLCIVQKDYLPMDPSAAAPIEVVAPYFGTLDDDAIRSMVVLSPWEGKSGPGTWARGNIRIPNSNGQLKDLVITGPRMRILYGGCRWNKLVFASVTDDHTVISFVDWLNRLGDQLKASIWARPDKYKPGSKSSARFTFDNDIFKTSAEPGIYSDEIRTRIASYRKIHEESGETIDVPDVDFYTMDENYDRTMVEPHELKAGGYLIPMIKVSYFRNIERFGLVLTVMKGLYDPPEPRKDTSKELELDLMNVEGF